MPDTGSDDEYDADNERRQREMQLLYQAVLQRSREQDELREAYNQWMKYDDQNQKKFNTRRDGGLNLI